SGRRRRPDGPPGEEEAGQVQEAAGGEAGGGTDQEHGVAVSDRHADDGGPAPARHGLRRTEPSHRVASRHPPRTNSPPTVKQNGWRKLTDRMTANSTTIHPINNAPAATEPTPARASARHAHTAS